MNSFELVMVDGTTRLVVTNERYSEALYRRTKAVELLWLDNRHFAVGFKAGRRLVKEGLVWKDLRG